MFKAGQKIQCVIPSGLLVLHGIYTCDGPYPGGEDCIRLKGFPREAGYYCDRFLAVETNEERDIRLANDKGARARQIARDTTEFIALERDEARDRAKHLTFVDLKTGDRFKQYHSVLGWEYIKTEDGKALILQGSPNWVGTYEKMYRERPYTRVTKL